MRADLILRGGLIRPLGRFGVTSCANLAIAGGQVLAAGGREVLDLRGPATRMVDLEGAAVLPGFNDAHAHVVYHGLSSFGADLTGSRSIRELQARLARAVPRTDPGDWLLGRGYSESELVEGRPPSRQELDAATGDRPAFVDHRGGHSRVANSAALAAAGLGPQTPDPVGGSLGREPGGELNGFLGEAAMRMVADHQPPPSLERRSEGILRCQRLLLSRGITSVGAAVNRGFAADLRAFQRLAETGRLRMRVNEFLSWELLPALLELGMMSRSGDALLRMGPVKVFVDGGAASGTAVLRAGGGTWRTPPAELADLVRKADAAGLQVAAHCIGDGAVAAMLDAIEAAQGRRSGGGRSRLRHRVEHCTVCPPDLRARMAALGAVAVMQPLMLRLGRDRFAETLGPDMGSVAAHGALLRAGVRVAFSSDLPVVEDPNPWAGIAAAVTDTLHPVTPLQALRAYTAGGAFTSCEENRKGTLEPGRLADLQVYARDPLASASPDSRPRLVMLGGKVVHTAHDA